MHPAGVSYGTATEPEKSLFWCSYGNLFQWAHNHTHVQNTKANTRMVCVQWAVSKVNFGLLTPRKGVCSRLKSAHRFKLKPEITNVSFRHGEPLRNRCWQAESLAQLEDVACVFQWCICTTFQKILPLPKDRHIFLRWVFLWGPAKATETSIKTRCVFSRVWLHTAIFTSVVSVYCN